MINILIVDTYTDYVSKDEIERAALLTLRHQTQAIDLDLSIVIDDDTRLHDLNKSFLGIDAPTDVLSFPSGGDEVDPETDREYIGDVVISYPRAEEQAALGGHSASDELQLLVVHGTLHLLGHDHAELDEKETMWAIQREILSQLGVKISRLPE